MQPGKRIATLLVIWLLLVAASVGALTYRYLRANQLSGKIRAVVALQDQLVTLRQEAGSYVVAHQQALIEAQAHPEGVAAVLGAPKPDSTYLAYFTLASTVHPPDVTTNRKLADAIKAFRDAGKQMEARLSTPGDTPTEDVGLAPGWVELTGTLIRERSAIVQLTGKLIEGHQVRVSELQATSSGQLLAFIGLAAGVLAFLFGGVVLLLVGRVISHPIHAMLQGLKNNQKLPEGKTPIGKLAAALNLYRTEIKETEHALSELGEGNYGYEISPLKHSEGIAIGLKKFSAQLQRIPDLQDKIKALEQDLEDNQNAYQEKERRVKAIEEELSHAQVRLQAIQQTLAVAELDQEGRFVRADASLAKLAGYQPDELQGAELTKLNGPHHDPDFFKQLWNTVKQGKPWYGLLKNQHKEGDAFWLASVVTPLPKNGGNGNGAAYLLAGYEVSNLKQSEESLRRNLAQLTDQLQSVRTKLDSVQTEHQQMLDDYQYQKHLENRLVQQQSALQELTRNVDLKEGNVQQAIRFITETTAHAMHGERVSLWFFTEEGQKIRSIDLYEKNDKRHSNGLEISRGDYPKLFETWQGERVISATDALTDPATADLSKTYLGPNGITSLLSAPIHLGGTNVGILLVEHQGEVRKWTLDEENFILSVAEILSLALEQGNRRVMEEELRMTLEESQALEEELRQNAEEIEATNEEMRRTQVELRGQINALNNAALVAETNIHGNITYANAEFAKAYGYERDEVLGQNHRLLRSDYHTEGFFRHMWETIEGGKIWKGEVQNRKKDGELVWALLTITPVVGFDGKPYKYIGVSFNITDQKSQQIQLKTALGLALEQEEALVSANEDMRRTQVELTGQLGALNNSSMVYETDMEGYITYVNHRLLEMTGYKEGDLVGQRYTLLKSGEQPDSLYTSQWKSVLKGQIWQGELHLKTKEDRGFWVVATITPVLDTSGEAIKAINVLVDITEQKTMEFRLKNQQSALLGITAHPAIKEGKVDEAFALIVRSARETLSAERVALWLYDKEGTLIRCVSVNELEAHAHPQGTVVDRVNYPVYFRTLERDRLIAASNATADPRTRELAESLYLPQGVSAVLDASIRQGGEIVGVLTVEHRHGHRDWSADEQTFLTSLADTAGLVLEQKERLLVDRLKVAYQQLEEKNQELLRAKAEVEEQSAHLTHSIRYAKRIQKNILPADEFVSEYLENWFITLRPKDIVGGDFYWFSPIEGKYVIVVADGTGHGVPGAFMTLIGYLLLNDIVNQKSITRPADILYHLHIRVRTALKQDEEGTESRDGMDVSVCTFDPETRIAEYAGANLPFNYYQDGELNVIKPDKKSIGGEQMEEERIFTNHTVQMKPGDAFYLYTDGLVDQLGGPEEKRFSTRRFRDLVLRTQHETMATQRALINMEWKEWKDDREQLDDVTLFGMKVT